MQKHVAPPSEGSAVHALHSGFAGLRGGMVVGEVECGLVPLQEGVRGCHSSTPLLEREREEKKKHSTIWKATALSRFIWPRSRVRARAICWSAHFGHFGSGGPQSCS